MKTPSLALLIVFLVSCGKQPSAESASPPIPADVAARCDKAMQPFVDANAEMLFLAIADDETGRKRFNKDNPLDSFDAYKLFLSMYEIVRFEGIVAVASEIAGRSQFQSGLSEKQMEILLAASDRASKAIGEKVLTFAGEKESNHVQAIQAMQKTRDLPRIWPTRSKINEGALEIVLGKEQASNVLNSAGYGLFSTKQLALRMLVDTEIETRSITTGTNSPLGEPWGVPDFLRKRRFEMFPSEFAVFSMVMGKCLSPDTVQKLSDSRSRYKTDEHFVVRLASPTEAEKKKPDIQVSVRQGESVQQDISFEHTSTILSTEMSCRTLDSAPEFLHVGVAFDGWRGTTVRLTLALKAEESAPQGPHYFRMAHRGQYDHGKIWKERVVRVDVLARQ